MVSSVADFLSHYGLLVLYLWLFVGIFIVPVPEEIVMLTLGILISRGVISDWAYLVACAGSLSGVTFSYFLGFYLGRLLLLKYGKWVGITENRLNNVEELFRRYGKWSISVGYFLPGTRHVMAIIAGMTHFGWKRYALFAYPAGIIWVVLMITLGYLAGDYWIEVFPIIATYVHHIVVFLIVFAIVGFLIYLFGFRKKSSL